MKRETLKRFKKLFEAQLHRILYNNNVVREDFSVCTDDKPDEIDQATTDIEQSMQMRLKNRENLYIKKIDEALIRMASGSYDICEECEGPISYSRLYARPTAKLCIFCKEEAELVESKRAFDHNSMPRPFFST